MQMSRIMMGMLIFIFLETEGYIIFYYIKR